MKASLQTRLEALAWQRSASTSALCSSAAKASSSMLLPSAARADSGTGVSQFSADLGFWKPMLNVFVTRTGQPMDVNFEISGPAHMPCFKMEMALVVPLNGGVFERLVTNGIGKNKKAAEGECAAAMAQELVKRGLANERGVCLYKNRPVPDEVLHCEMMKKSNMSPLHSPKNRITCLQKSVKRKTSPVAPDEAKSLKHDNGRGGNEFDRTLSEPCLSGRAKSPEAELKAAVHVATVAMEPLSGDGEPKSVKFDQSATYGGYDNANCREAVRTFLQNTGQRLDVIHRQVKVGSEAVWCAELLFFTAAKDTRIRGRAFGPSKKHAEMKCFHALANQLFLAGHIESAAMVQAQRLKKKVAVFNKQELPLVDVRVSEELESELDDYLSEARVKPVTENPHRPVSFRTPQSLLLDDIALEQFDSAEAELEQSEHNGLVQWAPPQAGWDAWRQKEIVKGPYFTHDRLVLVNIDWVQGNLEPVSRMLKHREQSKPVGKLQPIRKGYPAFSFRDKIIDVIRRNQVVLIRGDTGSGKTTQVCQYLLERYLAENRAAEFNCVVTQPRRISAISVASRVAAERGEPLGESVGYSVRFKTQLPRPFGSVLFCTVGTLLRRLEAGLFGISHVIVDEIHERDLNTDFTLIVLRDLVRFHADLKVILMSATVDTALFSRYFDNCPVLEIHGRVHPVQYYFLEDCVQALGFVPQYNMRKSKSQSNLSGYGSAPRGPNLNAVPLNREKYDVKTDHSMAKISEDELNEDMILELLEHIDSENVEGAVLIFLPGWNWISTMRKLLKEHSKFGTSRFVILLLHSRIPQDRQQAVFEHAPHGVRKIILSTNIAETSITVDDVVFVIDHCKARVKEYTTHNNMVTYATVWASKSNLEQRRGRAGRVQPGICYHLCSRARYEEMERESRPEMLRTPLYEVCLLIKLLNLGFIDDVLGKAIQPPPRSAIRDAILLLTEIRALDHSVERLTSLGKILARLPIEPVMGKTLVMASMLGVGELMCVVAAGTTFGDVFVSRDPLGSSLEGSHRAFACSTASDHIALLSVYQAWHNEGVAARDAFCKLESVSRNVIKQTASAARQLRDELVEMGFPLAPLDDQCHIDWAADPARLHLVTSILVHALYPNICFYRGKRDVSLSDVNRALINRMSVNSPIKENGRIQDLELESPFFIFEEKLRSGAVTCRQLTNVSPLQLLLFGAATVQNVGSGIITLDSWISLQMESATATKIVALRPCIEGMLIRVCQQPDAVLSPSDGPFSPADRWLVALLKQLSSNDTWKRDAESANQQ